MIRGSCTCDAGNMWSYRYWVIYREVFQFDETSISMPEFRSSFLTSSKQLEIRSNVKHSVYCSYYSFAKFYWIFQKSISIFFLTFPLYTLIRRNDACVR